MESACCLCLLSHLNLAVTILKIKCLLLQVKCLAQGEYLSFITFTLVVQVLSIFPGFRYIMCQDQKTYSSLSWGSALHYITLWLDYHRMTQNYLRKKRKLMSTSLEKLFEENDVFKNPANEIKSPTPPADKL